MAKKPTYEELEQRVKKLEREARNQKRNKGSIRRISPRKQAEKVLLESEDRLSFIAENAKVVIWIMDMNLRYMYISPYIKHNLDYTPDEYVLKPLHEVLTPSSFELCMQLFAKELEEEKNPDRDLSRSRTIEVEQIHRDGRIMCAEIHLTFIRDATGNAIGILGITRDITEIKHIEQQLQESEQFFRSIVENSYAGIYASDDKFRFTYVNDKLCEIAGYTREELLDMDLRRLIAEESLPLVADRYTRRREGQDVPSWYEFVGVRKDGEKRSYESSAAVVNYADGRVRTIGQVLDITRRKRAEEEKAKLEEQLRQAQKMESIGTLAGGIAHDFNNILSAILGYTEMALTKKKMDDHQRHYLEQVYKAGERARDLVKQILTFSRQQEQEQKPVLIARIIKEGIKMLRSTLPTTINITQNINDTLIMILADSTKVHQVLMNLCTNAAHAMREKGGTLDIQLVRERIESVGTSRPINLTAGNYAKLTVSDTGHGIDASIMDRIFDPFFTTKGPREGTGLGLSVVYGIVRDHGGAIDVSSKPDMGTTVTVYFPLIQAEEAIEERMPEVIPGGSERILFVEDEEALVELGSTMLTSLGYYVTPKTTSIEALELFRATPNGFDLVITDMTMPNMRGDDLARELLKMRLDIPIILCTGFSEMISEEKAKNLGIRQFIMKPISKKDLARVIREVLDKG